MSVLVLTRVTAGGGTSPSEEPPAPPVGETPDGLVGFDPSPVAAGGAGTTPVEVDLVSVWETVTGSVSVTVVGLAAH
jgi:hypothetical protein